MFVIAAVIFVSAEFLSGLLMVNYYIDRKILFLNRLALHRHRNAVRQRMKQDPEADGIPIVALICSGPADRSTVHPPDSPVNQGKFRAADPLMNSFIKSPHSVMETHSIRQPSQEEDNLQDMLDDLLDENPSTERDYTLKPLRM